MATNETETASAVMKSAQRPYRVMLLAPPETP